MKSSDNPMDTSAPILHPIANCFRLFAASVALWLSATCAQAAIGSIDNNAWGGVTYTNNSFLPAQVTISGYADGNDYNNQWFGSPPLTFTAEPGQPVNLIDILTYLGFLQNDVLWDWDDWWYYYLSWDFMVVSEVVDLEDDIEIDSPSQAPGGAVGAVTLWGGSLWATNLVDESFFMNLLNIGSSAAELMVDAVTAHELEHVSILNNRYPSALWEHLSFLGHDGKYVGDKDNNTRVEDEISGYTVEAAHLMSGLNGLTGSDYSTVNAYINYLLNTKIPGLWAELN